MKYVALLPLMPKSLSSFAQTTSQAVAIRITEHIKSNILWLIINILTVLFLIMAEEHNTIKVKPFPNIPVIPEKNLHY